MTTKGKWLDWYWKWFGTIISYLWIGEWFSVWSANSVAACVISEVDSGWVESRKSKWRVDDTFQLRRNVSIRVDNARPLSLVGSSCCESFDVIID